MRETTQSMDIDATFVDQIVEKIGRDERHVIAILQAIQKEHRYLPQTALERVCELTAITPAQIEGVSSFYSQFRHSPVGKHIINVCHGTACHVKGAGLVQDALYRHLKLAGGEDTDANGTFTVEKVACLGCCTLAPVVQIDHVTYGHLKPDQVPNMLRDFLEHGSEKGKAGSEFPPVPEGILAGDHAEIRIGLGSCCMARGSRDVCDSLLLSLANTGAKATVKPVGCVGMCHQTPLVEIVSADNKSTLYTQVGANAAKSIVKHHFRPKGLMGRMRHWFSRSLDQLWMVDEADPIARYAADARDPVLSAFLGKQKHLATEYCGQISPTDLDEYLKHGGFLALQQCFGSKPEEVIETVEQSGLRGRGGAGFPTGFKWSKVQEQETKLKYVVCNGDEGDPGAFMDRMLLESYPYRIIEGMAIAAYAVGAHEGYFYIRAEYPLAVERIREALRQCEARGFLGENIADSGWDLHLQIMEGAGAFVCGEETALLASIEGGRGMPRLRPPYPAESGLWGKPTLINNVETYALVPWILRNGGEAFAALGSGKSKGTKVFALAGKVARGGLIEVPMGMSLREIVEEIGGGIADGKRFKAVQVGGPSGGCVPAELAHTTVDYEALTAVGAIMGSGGLVVLDESDCMVDIARYFLEFTQDQSCGKCTYCRIGTRRMLDILERICAGKGKAKDLDELEQLAEVTHQGSICGLGKTAPNPVLSTLLYFRDEYEAHLEGRCPAGKCKELITYVVTDACIGCTLCAQHCPVDAIPVTPYQKHHIDPDKCTRCDVCREICPVETIEVQ